MKLLKEAIEAKPAPAAVLDTNSNGKKIADIVKKIVPEERAAEPLELAGSNR